MKIETTIYQGKILIELVNTDERGKETIMAKGEIDIEEIFEEMALINEERRIENAREASLEGEIRAGRKQRR